MARRLVALLLAAAVLFGWGAAVHMVLPVGHMGFSNLPDEDAVVSTLRSGVPDPGLYFFPGMDLDRELSDAEMEAWEDSYREGPIGLLVLQPDGDEPMAAMTFAKQFGIDVVVAFFLAVVVAAARGGFLARVGVATAAGVAGWAAILLPYWNWFHFPLDFALGQGLEVAGGALLAGIFLAVLLPRRRT